MLGLELCAWSKAVLDVVTMLWNSLLQQPGLNRLKKPALVFFPNRALKEPCAAFVLDFILRKQMEINLLLESNHFFILFCGCVGNTLQKTKMKRLKFQGQTETSLDDTASSLNTSEFNDCFRRHTSAAFCRHILNEGNEK